MLSVCGSIYLNPNLVDYVRTMLDRASKPDDIEFVIAEDEAGSDLMAQCFDKVRTMTRNLTVIPVPKEERIAHFEKCVTFYEREHLFPPDMLRTFRDRIADYAAGKLQNIWFPPNRNYNRVIEASHGDIILHTPVDFLVDFDVSAAHQRFSEALETEEYLCAFFGLRKQNEKLHHGARICNRKLFDALKESDPKFSGDRFSFDERWFVRAHGDDDWNLRAKAAGARADGWEKLFGERLLFEMTATEPWQPEYLCGTHLTLTAHAKFFQTCIWGYLAQQGYRPPLNPVKPGPKAALRPDEMYNHEFFEKRLSFRACYTNIAKWLLANLDFQSVLDLGCGDGHLLGELHRAGKQVRGVDGSPHGIAIATEAVRAFLSVHDLRRPLSADPAELVVCVEVAEHLPKTAADTLVDTITKHTKNWVYFAAATPGQGGHGHLNEQPPEYWLERFEKRGFRVDKERSDNLRAHLSQSNGLPWLVKNSTILQRQPSAK